MPDTLKQVEQKIQEYKKKYTEYLQYFKTEESRGGTEITKMEQAVLYFIDTSLKKIELEIIRRRKLLKKVTITDVKDHYSLLLKRIDQFVLNDIDGVYFKWHEHILSVGNCYSTAFDSFQETVEAQDKYKADLAAIAGMILSIVGVGTLSWISNTGQLAKVLYKLSTIQQNVVEDIAQEAWDKGLGYIVGKWPIPMKNDFKSPLVFQNNFSLKVLKGYQTIRTELLKHAAATIVCEEKMLEHQTAKTGNAQNEYENYIRFEANVLKAIMEIKKWTTDIPPSINSEELTKEFERGFWAGWIPRLKGSKIVSQRIDTDSPIREQYEIDTIDTWFSSDLKKRLNLLIDLEGIGVGKDGLRWVSENDVELLISWAKSFKPAQIF